MTDTPTPTTQRFTLRDLPLSARLVLSAFLISTGIGYFSALVQLHFQHAKPGSLLPEPSDAERVYFGKTEPISRVESLLIADENLPFNSHGQMRSAFTKRTSGWSRAITDVPERKNNAEKGKRLRAEREGEREAVVAWVRAGAIREDYDKDEFRLPDDLQNQPITKVYVSETDKNLVKIKSIFTDRCIRCHQKEAPDDPKAGQYPMETWERLHPYVTPQQFNGMSLKNLAQTTHVHLLGFSMLYGMTGLILALSTYPGWLRVFLCPLPLIAQVIDISCWWLARFDPTYAHVIMYTGGVVAMGLMLHIVLSLLNMYGVAGKLVLLLLFVGAAGGGFMLKTQLVDPFLAAEKGDAATAPLDP